MGSECLIVCPIRAQASPPCRTAAGQGGVARFSEKREVGGSAPTLTTASHNGERLSC